MQKLNIMPELDKSGLKKLFFINCTIMFAVLYFISYQVPVLSDDYSYYSMGLSFRSHLDHYLGWNGRVIADWTSSILLRLFSRPVNMALNTLVFVIVMVLITLLPAVIRQRPLIGRGSSIMLWIVLLAYWIANPNLGQTSFWLVGSVNYLWTLMWAGFYFTFFLYLLLDQRAMGRRQAVLLGLLGIFAGLSNEALGITVILFTLSMFILFWKDKKRTLLTGLISAAAGYSVLFFAPGVRIRSQSDVFLSWYELPAFDKLLTHLFTRMAGTFNRFHLLYMVIIVVMIAALWGQSGKKTDGRSLFFLLLFFALSYLAVLAFIASPTMPPRSGNVSLFYSLLMLSVAMHILMDSEARGRYAALGIILCCCAVYFIPEYLFIHHAYKQTKVQAEIREDIINEEKERGEIIGTAYDLYFTRLLKNSDKLDTHRSNNAYLYYGMEEIRWRAARFNYAVIRTTRPVPVDMKLDNGLTLNNLYVNFALPFEQTLVFEFDKELLDHVKEGDKRLYVHLFVDGRDEYINASISLNDFIQIGGKYYYGKSIPTPDLRKLHTIEFGFFNPDTKENSGEYRLDYRQYSRNR